MLGAPLRSSAGDCRDDCARRKDVRAGATAQTRRMTTKRLLLLLVVAMADYRDRGADTARCHGGPSARTFQVTGIVTAPMAERRVMVAHDDIPGYMPAMTMPFAVAADETPSLAAGDRVRFTLRVTADGSQAEGFEVTGHDAALAAALRADDQAGAEAAQEGRRASGVLAHDVGGAAVHVG